MTKIGKIADVEVGVSVPLILDKDSLEPEARDVVRFGGEHTSVLNALLAKQGQTTILASIPEIFLADMMKLSTTRKRQVKWKMSAREVVGENFAGVVTRSDGVFLEHKRTSRKFLFGNLGKCVIVKAKGREQEWEIIFYEIVHSDLATLTATISERRFAVKFPPKLANRFALASVYAKVAVSDQAETERLVSGKIDTLPTKTKIDGEVLDLKSMIQPLIAAMACAYRLACGVKTSFEEVGPREQPKAEAPEEVGDLEIEDDEEGEVAATPESAAG